MADYESSHTGQELDAAIDAVALKQDKLPNAAAAGKILKSTNTTGGLEWGDMPASAVWGNITGTLSAQTDLQTALNGKQATLTQAQQTAVDSGISPIKVEQYDEYRTSKADVAATLAGYGITDANINNGVITLGNNTITPLTQHQDISGKADKSTTYTKTEVDTALTAKLDASLKGANNGLAELDVTGKVPTTQLPSFVDDVIEGYYYNNKFYADAEHTVEITGETGKIYVDLVTNKTYRWSGTQYVEISASLALGETSSTAYRGDRGKTAYDHSQLTSGNPHNVTYSDVGAITAVLENE